ncbi:sensor histidine kinase [Puerhibacterium puerhi]|uniref:sensor histidine kinase n=1 Tax=Puerhibacterium puerhi TaxID=2692623 RepID=UPI001357994E|nr:histidine kinase [Puerhibacterium puerhi]
MSSGSRWWRGLAGEVARAVVAPSGEDRRGLVVDAVSTLAIGALTLAVGLGGIYEDAPVVPGWWHLVLLALGCLLLLAKRAHPVRALLGGAALVAVDLWWGGSLALLMVLWDLLYAAALWMTPRARRWLWIATSTVAGGAAVAGAVAAGDLRVVVSLGLTMAAVLLMPLWWATTVRQKSELAALERQRADLAERQAALERERAADLERIGELDRHEAVRAERAAMARDLHDAVASHLSAIAIHSGAALAGPADPGRDRTALEQVRASAVASLEEMRAMILLLRSDVRRASEVAAPARLTTPAAVGALLDRARQAGSRVELDDAGGVLGCPVPAVVDQALHRIVQEALTNVVKHAPGSAVVVRVRHVAGAHGERVELVVADDGGASGEGADRGRASGAGAPGGARLAPGRDHAALSGGTGLLTMRERAEGLGGTFAAGPTPSGGWEVRTAIPLAGAQADGAEEGADGAEAGPGAAPPAGTRAGTSTGTRAGTRTGTRTGTRSEA